MYENINIVKQYPIQLEVKYILQKLIEIRLVLAYKGIHTWA